MRFAFKTCCLVLISGFVLRLEEICGHFCVVSLLYVIIVSTLFSCTLVLVLQVCCSKRLRFRVYFEFGFVFE